MKKHSFEFPADQLGRPGAVKAYRGNKNDYVTPVADLSGMAELLTNTPLEAIEVYSQFGQDRLGAVLINRAQGWAYSDRSGTLFIEESEDNNSWTASHSVAVKGGVQTASGWVSLTKRYYRFRFENGNQKQSEFVLYQSVGTGGDMAFSYTDVIFHENAAEAGEGSIFSAGAWKKLLVEITGTAESGHVAFWGDPSREKMCRSEESGLMTGHQPPVRQAQKKCGHLILPALRKSSWKSRAFPAGAFLSKARHFLKNEASEGR